MSDSQARAIDSYEAKKKLINDNDNTLYTWIKNSTFSLRKKILPSLKNLSKILITDLWNWSWTERRDLKLPLTP